MAKKGNIIVGQSGGPTSVINSSLAGVYKTAKERGFHKVYGMLHGIQGFLDEQYVDLSTQIHSDMDIELLKRTPSAFLGSCRYKLPEIHENPEIYEKIFQILDKLNIEVFIYIGGNDSMDTIKKLSDFAIVKGHRYHPAQSSPCHTEDQRRHKVRGAAGKALAYSQRDDGQNCEIEKAKGASPEKFPGFHHFPFQKTAEKAGGDVDGNDADVYDGF